jgi:hypothetical protein
MAKAVKTKKAAPATRIIQKPAQKSTVPVTVIRSAVKTVSRQCKNK